MTVAALLLISACLSAAGSLAGFLSVAFACRRRGQPVEWGNALLQAGLWALASLLIALVILPIALISSLVPG
jgi:hypothetical protein